MQSERQGDVFPFLASVPTVTQPDVAIPTKVGGGSQSLAYGTTPATRQSGDQQDPGGGAVLLRRESGEAHGVSEEENYRSPDESPPAKSVFWILSQEIMSSD